MASFLQAENLSKSYGDRVLFRNISFNINEGDKIALIAPNGTGKSSLLKILAGVDSSDRGGEVRFMRDLRVAFLDQHTDFDPERTLFDEVYSRLGETGRIISEYERAIVSEDRGRIERAMAAMDAAACWNAEQRVRQVLSSLQLTRLDQKMGQLSGGEAKRAAIASMLLQEADFLVMDEPTNHLDIDVIEFLEGYLQKSRCTLLMVTHDRYFLDRVCNTIFELDRGNLYTYRGNYSYFLEKRDERYRNMQADIDKSRNLLRRELEWIRSTPQARTGKARYRINAFYDLKQKASVSLAQQSMSINVATSRLGGKIIDCEDVSLHFGQRCMLDDFSYKFSRYERVGIVGKNGVGKSTFLNLLTGAIAPDAGTIERGETLRIGYYRQQGMSFRAGQTVFDVVQGDSRDGHYGRRPYRVGHVDAQPFSLPARDPCQAYRGPERRRAAEALSADHTHAQPQLPDPRRAYERSGHHDAERAGGLSLDLQGVSSDRLARPLFSGQDRRPSFLSCRMAAR